MKIYAYTNPNHTTEQILEDKVPLGEFDGRSFDGVYTAPIVSRKESGGVTVSKSDGEQQLIEIVRAGDVVITSTLTNFSIDFISALQTVAEFNRKNVRVIAYQEEFDLSQPREQALLESLPMMLNFRRASFKARQKKHLAGIAKAVAEGKYKGKKAFELKDFPEFGTLYSQYMTREISKGKFAENLGVSRPTLDKLLDNFRKNKGGSI